MKNHYTFKKWLLLTLVTLSLTINTNASHMVGSYMWYTHISGNNYTLHLRYFRDCSGITAATQCVVCYSSASLAVNNTVTLPKISFIQAPINSCASSGNGYLVEQHDYEATVSLPGQANDWVFAFSECCRNGALTTIQSGGLYTYCTLDNLTFGSNNSPQFPVPFLGLYCAGFLTNVNYSTTDVDGDSIAYSLVSAQDGNGGCPNVPFNCTYIAPYSPAQPLASFTPITLNSSTGMFSFTPALIQVGEVCILVEEFRNGIKIGSVKRDDQIVIVNGITNPAKIEGTIYGDYNNNGTQDAGENGWAGISVVALPSNIMATTDSNGFYSIDVIPGTYSITIGNVPQWFTPSPASYSINVATLGQVFSNNDFALAPTANITDLATVIAAPQFARAGWQTTFNISVVNEGTLPATGVLSFQHDLGYSYISANPVYNTYSSNTMTWNLPTIFPGQTYNYQVVMLVDSTLTDGDTLFYQAMTTTSIPDNDSADNTWAYYQIINNSFDPNFIEVNPSGNISTGFVTNRNWLYYTIHFQNIGSVAAINISIANGLDYNLDASSIEFITSSHPCNYNVNGIGLVQFGFPNINLPSQFINEPASHGFAMYRVKTKPTLVPGDCILNAASITFDANAPINTNTVSTWVEAQPTGISTVALNNNKVSVYPNPFTNELNIALDAEDNVVFEIFEITGKSVIKQNLNQSSTIKIQDIAKGIYVYKISYDNGNFATGKLIKK